MESELGWGWTCECLDYDAPLDLDALVGTDEAAEPGYRGRRGTHGDGGGRNYRRQARALHISATPLCQAALRLRRSAANPARPRRCRVHTLQVCKHWLRGLCMKGERCDYLHIYDPARMPVCHLYATYGECNNKDCIFAHRAVEERADECPYYNRGFCSKGATCRQQHVRRLPCALYLQGFCPDGPTCEYGHPKFELPDFDDDAVYMPEQHRTVRAQRKARACVDRSRP